MSKAIVDMTEAEFKAFWEEFDRELIEQWSVEMVRETDRRARVFQAILRSEDGLTCDEAERITRLPHQTVSARMKELRDGGVIEKTGETRLTRNRKEAAVHRLTKHAMNAVKSMAKES